MTTSSPPASDEAALPIPASSPPAPGPAPLRPAAPVRGTGFVITEPLQVAPALVGRRLATPSRRALALLIDLAVLGVLANLGSWGLVAAMLLLAWQVHAALAVEGARPWLARLIAGVLVAGALAVAWEELAPPSDDTWTREAREAERAVARALEPALAGEGGEAGEVARKAGAEDEDLGREIRREVTAALREAGIAVTVSGGEGASSAAGAAAEAVPSASAPASASVSAPASAPASAPTGAAPTAVASATAASAAELERLAAELRRLRAEHREPGLLDRLNRGVRELAEGFGWGIVYFSLLPALWQGRTLGKALLKLRIVDLSGRPLTPLRGLKRYGGYVAGLATGGLGFAQALWDPNRQALHDKAAHTVVLDERPGLGQHPTEPAV